MRSKFSYLIKPTAFLFLVLLLGYFISLALWNSVSLPFSNPYNAVGALTFKHFNPTNNSLRWILFILIPTFLLLVLDFIPFVRKMLTYWINQINLSGSISELSPIQQTEKKFTKNFLFVIFAFSLSIILLLFGKELTTANFDMFHEGEQLTPAINFIIKKGIWTSTLFVHGPFYDVFTAITGWKLFGVNSIGSFRLAVNLFTTLALFSLLLLFISINRLITNKSFIVFTTELMILVYLLTSRIQNINRRDMPMLFGVTLLFFALSSGKRILYFCSGLLSVVCFFYSADPGVYFTAILIVYPVILGVLGIYNKRDLIVSALTLWGGILSGFIALFLFVGNKEFSSFIANFKYFLHTRDLIDAYIYPYPNLLVTPRFTLPLILSAFNVLFLVFTYLYIYRKNTSLKNVALIHVVLTFLSLVHYRSVLSRADLLHVEANCTFIFLVFAFNVGLLVYSFAHEKLIYYTTAFLTVVILLSLIVTTGKQISFDNLISFNRRAFYFVNRDSIEFINNQRVEGLNEMKELFKSEACVMNLTSEAALPYLLGKPSCGRIYISYFASAEPVRSELLSDIIKYHPTYLIYSSKLWVQNLDNITNDQRFPNVIAYVNTHYKYYKTFSNYWVVYSRVDN